MSNDSPTHALITTACCDPRLSATAATVLAFTALEIFRGNPDVPMPVKSQALSETMRRSARTVSHALESLVVAGYLEDRGRDGRVRLLAVPDAVPLSAAHALGLRLPRRFHDNHLN